MNAPAPSSRRAFLSPLLDRSLARADLATRLKRETSGEVLFDAFTRGRYSTDASVYRVEPVGVFVPRTEADLAAAVDIARDLGVPILPRGGGTSQCGQTVGAALVVDCSKYLRELVSVDAEARRAVVQPGIALDALNAQLRKHGLWYPVDVSTSAQATIGGMAGNNSCGSRSIAYGNMVHNVAGIDAILADGTRQYFGEFERADGRPGEMTIGSQRVRELVTRLYEIHRRESDEIRRVWPRVLRRVGGYNLDVFELAESISERPYWSNTGVPALNFGQLLVGSEGTLATFRRLHLHLSPLPRAKTLGVVNFPSFQRAMECTREIVRLGPVAVELVDRTMIDLSRANPAFRPVIDAALRCDAAGGAPGWTDAILLVEFAGETRDAQLASLARLVELMADLGLAGSVVEMPDEGAQKALWEVRKAGLNIMMSMKGDGKPVSFIEDCAVPLEHLAEYTAALTEVFTRHGTQGTWYAHASVGTLHVRPILDLRRGDATRMRAIAEEAGALVRRFKGAFSGEHGDGLVRSEWVGWQFGERLTRAFEDVKDAFDPQGILNPGKIVRSTKMDDATLFRFPPNYAVQPLPVAPGFDWSTWDVRNDPSVPRDRLEARAAEIGGSVDGTVLLTAPGTGGDPTGGFAKAVEMCNNNGHCRKFDAGTMCPSFRVTRDERHVTRGRANTLRLALSGALGPDAITSDAMADTMSLCVSCKGCKRDCPTGIDMAKMKVEFRRQRVARHGLALRDRIVAFLPRYAPWASRLSFLANLRDRVPGLPRLTERWLGLSARRSLPAWASEPYSARVTNEATLVAAAGTGTDTVVLWADTFNDRFDPGILADARRVLESAGRRVLVSTPAQGDRPLCCGRTFLAAGLVDEARAEAARTLRALAPLVETGAAVIGLEPSCLLTMRDEFLAHRWDAEPDGERLAVAARALSTRAMLLEEWLVAERRAGRLELPLKALPQPRALVHGHCHQKAFGAFGPVTEVLGWIPGLKVESIESSCCGMAGSFGYESEHVDVSFAMGELSLLPAVRAAGEDALVVADGTSCRHQIADGAQRQALHVAQVLARAL